MKGISLLALAATVPLSALAVHPAAVEMKPARSKPGPVLMQTGDMRFQDAPDLGPGAQVAVLKGDPGKTGSHYTLRLKVGDGFRIPAHWHPGEETLVVIQGTFALGLGDKFDDSKLKPLGPGSFAVLPAKARHFAVTKGETVVDAHGVGPFKTLWVNPAQTPGGKK